MPVLFLAAALLLAWTPAQAAPCLRCGYFIVKNECWRPARVALYYHEWEEGWTATGFYHIAPGEKTTLAKAVPKVLYDEDRFGRPVYTRTKTLVRRKTGKATYYFYGEAADGSGVVWGGCGKKGSKWVTVGGRKLSFRKKVDEWNNAYLTLSCAKPRKHGRDGGRGGGSHGIGGRL